MRKKESRASLRFWAWATRRMELPLIMLGKTEEKQVWGSFIFDMFELPATWWQVIYTGHIQSWKEKRFVFIGTDIYLRFVLVLYTCSTYKSITVWVLAGHFIYRHRIPKTLFCPRGPILWPKKYDHGFSHTSYFLETGRLLEWLIKGSKKSWAWRCCLSGWGIYVELLADIEICIFDS